MWILTLFFFLPNTTWLFFAGIGSLPGSFFFFFLFLLLVAQHRPYPQGDGSKLRLENLGLVQESAHGGLILFVVVLFGAAFSCLVVWCTIFITTAGQSSFASWAGLPPLFLFSFVMGDTGGPLGAKYPMLSVIIIYN